jgi:hypothetical protein
MTYVSLWPQLAEENARSLLSVAGRFPLSEFVVMPVRARLLRRIDLVFLANDYLSYTRHWRSASS